jgi:hypothetical protein
VRGSQRRSLHDIETSQQEEEAEGRARPTAAADSTG